MIKDHLHAPLELVLKDYLDECPRGTHAHHFFELVYIVDGSGKQQINHIDFAYKKGDLFLIAPNDSHTIHIEKPTRLFFIRLHPTFISAIYDDRDLLRRLETVLEHAGHETGCLLRNNADRASVGQLMEIIIREHQQEGLYSRELVNQLVHTLLVIIARNVAREWDGKIHANTEDKTLQILQYIHANIYHPEKLRIDIISKHFNVAETYLGKYFKKSTNETLQQYILQYKLKLIDNRLLHSNMRINEIADEFGFTDKSHLNRTFKKYRGVSPKEYRSQPRPVDRIF